MRSWTIIDVTPPLATGELLEHRRKLNSYHDFNPFISGSWSLEKAADNAIRLNARWSPGQFDLFQRNRVSVTGEPPRDDNLIQDYDNGVFELGGDITRPLGGGAIKLVGLATRRKVDNFDEYISAMGCAARTSAGRRLQANEGGSERDDRARRTSAVSRSRPGSGGVTRSITTKLFVIESDGAGRNGPSIDSAR
jgi:hypothetical protein